MIYVFSREKGLIKLSRSKLVIFCSFEKKKWKKTKQKQIGFLDFDTFQWKKQQEKDETLRKSVESMWTIVHPDTYIYRIQSQSVELSMFRPKGSCLACGIITMGNELKSKCMLEQLILQPAFHCCLSMHAQQNRIARTRRCLKKENVSIYFK